MKEAKCDHTPDEITEAFQTFQSPAAPTGMIRMKDLQNALVNHLQRENQNINSEIQEVFRAFEDSTFLLL